MPLSKLRKAHAPLRVIVRRNYAEHPRHVVLYLDCGHTAKRLKRRDPIGWTAYCGTCAGVRP